MSVDIILQNLVSPPVLFFFLGMLAVAIKSDLEIPQALSKLFSFYLLISIGFKGGAELAHSGFSPTIALTLIVAVLLALITPLYVFVISLRAKVGLYNAGAIAATYGSVSAVTFVTAISFLEMVNEPFGGHMVAALALMESPSIIVGVLLIRYIENKRKGNLNGGSTFTDLLKESFSNSSVVLIMGSLAIGLISGEKGATSLAPFTTDIFKGMLCFFLLDMGLLAAKRISSLKRAGWKLVIFGIVVPLTQGMLSVLLAYALGLTPGNALLLAVLWAGASYIAVPAAFSVAVPRANPGLYVPMALAITFPVNVILGIPLYYWFIQIMLT